MGIETRPKLIVPEPIERAAMDPPSRARKAHGPRVCQTRTGRPRATISRIKLKKTPARGSGRAPAAPRASLDPGELRFMLPTLVERLPKGPEWLVEIKWDGVRVLVLRIGGVVELWSRNGLPVARQ